MGEDVSKVRSGGRELSVRRLGRGDRITILHGGPGLDHHLLLPLARPLAERFEVWLPDLPGHGASPPLEGARPGLRDTVLLLESWFSGLPGGAGVLIGHSLGAWFVSDLLRRGRLSPRAAVLLCPLAAPRTGRDRRVMLHPGRMAKTGASPRDLLLAQIESECEGAVPNGVVPLVDDSRLRPPEAFAELTRVLDTVLRIDEEPFHPPCPVLVASGERDRTTPRPHAEAAARSILGATRIAFPDRGHYPFLEDPATVVAAVREFAERAYSSRRATT